MGDSICFPFINAPFFKDPQVQFNDNRSFSTALERIRRNPGRSRAKKRDTGKRGTL